ncbi:Actin-related protein 2/3 complex subunit 2B [Linum perenne]
MKKKESTGHMGCFERESPALKQLLLRLYHSEKPVEIDHHLYEFGSVEYHVQLLPNIQNKMQITCVPHVLTFCTHCFKSSAADPHHSFLSVSTPQLSEGEYSPKGLSAHTLQMVTEICSEAAEIMEPSKEGYQLTLKLNFCTIPKRKDSEKVVRRIASVQAVIVSSQLKEIFRNVNTHEICKPIKLVYYPREPFYVIRQPQKMTAVFPTRFKEHSDVIIATAFFQELMDVGSSKRWAKAPPCIWSPIPPPELRGESIEDLSTNGGFVSFDISSRHVQGKRLEKTVWSLLNFYAYVKNHIKVLHKGTTDADDKIKKRKGRRHIRKLVTLSKFKTLKRRFSNIINKIKHIRYRLKIHGFSRFRRRWLTLPKFSSSKGYARLE